MSQTRVLGLVWLWASLHWEITPEACWRADTSVVTPAAHTNKELKICFHQKRQRNVQNQHALIQSRSCRIAFPRSGGCVWKTGWSLAIYRFFWPQSLPPVSQKSCSVRTEVEQRITSAGSSLHVIFSLPYHNASCLPDLYAELSTSLHSPFLSHFDICFCWQSVPFMHPEFIWLLISFLS